MDAMASDDALIRFKNVNFLYDAQRPVLRGVDFVLRPGERVGLTGPNGSGKTTFLHLIVGLHTPTSGEIEIFGKPRRVEKDFHDVRTRVGLVFQDPEDQLFCPTVIEDVAFGPLNLGKRPDEAKATARTTLEKLGLESLENRITYHLSFGEKKLVSLATVLAMEPEVLLLDEPIAGLDPDATDHIPDVLSRLDLPMIVVAHDRGFLTRVTSSRLILKGGRLHSE